MDSAMIYGRVLLSGKLNESTTCEVGVNINHPQSFPQIEKRVRLVKYLSFSNFLIFLI